MTIKLLGRSGLAALAMTALLSGCTRNTLIIVAPPPRVVIAPAVIPCRLTPLEARPFTPTGRANPLMLAEIPPVAIAARVSGCAGVMFQLSPDGAPIDPRLVREAPLGFGFGDAALTALAGNRFHPGQIDGSWHYMIFGMIVRPH